ncbi:hypothetical protein CTheo_5325 [Ceratobasidium theobromae]|uniref:Uncharacterized protein n=1 Tax=Ceratobasidium theobromae TaxID=1582974 RepID=A0A5N5QI77_9AGAM|nr:hypothetical protein CTheo_5325 [Ceratobasidium theobromae]
MNRALGATAAPEPNPHQIAQLTPVLYLPLPSLPIGSLEPFALDTSPSETSHTTFVHSRGSSVTSPSTIVPAHPSNHAFNRCLEVHFTSHNLIPSRLPRD